MWPHPSQLHAGLRFLQRKFSGSIFEVHRALPNSVTMNLYFLSADILFFFCVGLMFVSVWPT